jgi:hypothetical protein
MWNTRKYEEVDFFSITVGDRVQVKQPYASRFSNDYVVRDVDDTIIGRVITMAKGAPLLESTDADKMLRRVL